MSNGVLCFVDRDWRYGFHVTKHPSMLKTFKEVAERDVSAMQVYISNSRSKAPPTFDYTDLAVTRAAIEKHQEIYVVIHGCLLYNLAGTVGGPTDNNYNYALSTTLEGLTAELDFAVALGRPSDVGVGVVVHPGSRKDKDAGHAEVSKSVVKVLTRETPESERIAEDLGITPKEVRKRRKVILENSAGEGTKLCSTLEEIASVIQGVPKKLRKQVGVCIDTAHGFGKGLYDWGADGEIDRFYEDFDRIIGLKHLEVFHFNDSCCSEDKKLDAPFGSRKDRHQNLGMGYVFGDEERQPKVLKFMQEARKHGIPVIGEPPGPGIYDFTLVSLLTYETENPLVFITGDD